MGEQRKMSGKNQVVVLAENGDVGKSMGMFELSTMSWVALQEMGHGSFLAGCIPATDGTQSLPLSTKTT